MTSDEFEIALLNILSLLNIFRKKIGLESQFWGFKILGQEVRVEQNVISQMGNLEVAEPLKRKV